MDYLVSHRLTKRISRFCFPNPNEPGASSVASKAKPLLAVSVSYMDAGSCSKARYTKGVTLNTSFFFKTSVKLDAIHPPIQKSTAFRVQIIKIFVHTRKSRSIQDYGYPKDLENTLQKAEYNLSCRDLFFIPVWTSYS